MNEVMKPAGNDVPGRPLRLSLRSEPFGKDGPSVLKIVARYCTYGTEDP
jgi:hypothetical protein